MDINLPLAPPVNNKLQMSLHNKLDAMAYEKIKVANTQLNSRRALQEKIIDKHRKDIEKFHANETQRLRREMKKVREKKPDYVHEEYDASNSRARAEAVRPRSLSDSNSNLSYCRRFYAHHYDVRDDTKKSEPDHHCKKESQNDFFNLKFRLYYVNMMNNAVENFKLRHEDPEDFGFKCAHRDVLGTPFSPRELANGDMGYHTQTSVEDSENDDVFAKSHDSFKRDYANIKLKHSSLQSLNEITRHDAQHSTDNHLTPNSLNGGTGKQKRLIRRHTDRTRRRRRTRTVSDTQSENIEVTQRRSKMAFEKIFNGLL